LFLYLVGKGGRRAEAEKRENKNIKFGGSARKEGIAK